MAEKKSGTKKKARRKTSSGKSAVSGVRAKTTAKKAADRKGTRNHAVIDNTGGQTGKLILDETLTISSAANLKNKLLDYPGKYRKIEIDGSSVELIDTAAFQVIISFISELHKESVEVSWAGKSEVLVNTAALLGLKSYLEL